MKLLLVEDDRETAHYVADGFRECGHSVDHVSSGRDGLLHATDETYDVIVTDRRLPGMDGLSLVKALRATDIQTPVLFLSALSAVPDRVEALEAGGDDYLTKPFAFTELAARVNALARRPALAREKTAFRIADLEMNLVSRVVTRGGVTLSILPREFRLLEFLMRHANEVVTRTTLLERVWEYNFDPHTNVVETHVSRLRAKVDRGHKQPLIHTVRGAGYSLRTPQS